MICDKSTGHASNISRPYMIGRNCKSIKLKYSCLYCCYGTGGPEGRSRGSLPPGQSTRGLRQDVWHGHVCPFYHVVGLARTWPPSPTNVTDGATHCSFTQAFVPCDEDKPCELQSLDDGRERFPGTHKALLTGQQCSVV